VHREQRERLGDEVVVVKAISWVSEELNEWKNTKGDGGIIYYVNGVFHDDDSFSIGTKDRDAALDHRSRLVELTDLDIEFTLENGKPRGGDHTGTKWVIAKGGYPGDVREPYGFSDTARPAVAQSAPASVSVAPVAKNQVNDAINRAVALKAAANWVGSEHEILDVLGAANTFLEWLTSDHGSPSTAEVMGEGSEGPSSGPAGTSPSASLEVVGDSGEGVPTSEATSEWGEKSPEAGEEILELLNIAYGGKAHALRAARTKHGTGILRLGQLTEYQAGQLLEEAES